MSRSRRHTPIMGLCSHSDKPGKIIAHRSLRNAERKALSACLDWDDFVGPVLREVSNVWSFPKDGKTHIEADSRYMRK